MNRRSVARVGTSAKLPRAKFPANRSRTCATFSRTSAASPTSTRFCSTKSLKVSLRSWRDVCRESGRIPVPVCLGSSSGLRRLPHDTPPAPVQRWRGLPRNLADVDVIHRDHTRPTWIAPRRSSCAQINRNHGPQLVELVQKRNQYHMKPAVLKQLFSY